MSRIRASGKGTEKSRSGIAAPPEEEVDQPRGRRADRKPSDRRRTDATTQVSRP
jgi:hypothetical protein